MGDNCIHGWICGGVYKGLWGMSNVICCCRCCNGVYVGDGSQCVYRVFHCPPEVVGVLIGVGGMTGVVHSSRSALGVFGGVGSAAGATHSNCPVEKW